MTWADVYFGLRGAYDLSIHDDIPAAALAANQEAMGKDLDLALAEYALVLGACAQRGASAASRYRPGND